MSKKLFHKNSPHIPNTMRDSYYLASITGFIRSIGIRVQEETLSGETFLPGVLIRRGVLLIDREKLQYPGDVLHEAGHIAVTAKKDREHISGNVAGEDPEKEGEEMAVLLWSYLVARHIDLPPEVVFHADGYKGEGTWLVREFSSGNYLGLPLLRWMGMTEGAGENEEPVLKSWLRS